MSVEAIPGGKRRIDRVLDPRFVADVEGLALDELRSRRSEAEEEERSISYLRRLLQGRIDILRAELARRARGGDHQVTDRAAGPPGTRRRGGPGRSPAIPKIRVPEPFGR